MRLILICRSLFVSEYRLSHAITDLTDLTIVKSLNPLLQFFLSHVLCICSPNSVWIFIYFRKVHFYSQFGTKVRFIYNFAACTYLLSKVENMSQSWSNGSIANLNSIPIPNLSMSEQKQNLVPSKHKE